MLMEEPCRALNMALAAAPARPLLELTALYGFASTYALVAVLMASRESGYAALWLVSYVLYLASAAAAHALVTSWLTYLERRVGVSAPKPRPHLLVLPPLYAYEAARLLKAAYGLAQLTGVRHKEPRELVLASISLSLVTLGAYAVALTALAASLIEAAAERLAEVGCDEGMRTKMGRPSREEARDVRPPSPARGGA